MEKFHQLEILTDMTISTMERVSEDVPQITWNVILVENMICFELFISGILKHF